MNRREFIALLGGAARLASYVLAERFPENRLAITWEYTNAIWQREAELLMAYEAAFGELPQPRSSAQ